MPNTKYRYNPESLNFDKVKLTFKHYFLNIFSVLAPAAIIGTIVFFGVSNFFDSPNDRRLKNENKMLESEYTKLFEQFEQASIVLEDLKKRDEKLYSAIFETSAEQNFSSEFGFSGYSNYEDYNLTLISDSLINSNEQNLKRLVTKFNEQLFSIHLVYNLARNKSESIRIIPSIQPVKNKDLKMVLFGYGHSIDPIYKTPTFHEGIDFSAPTGTEVYTTADGIVKEVDLNSRKYGQYIVIEHGVGFETFYANLSKVKVRKNQKVAQGTVIGLVGNTGKSISSHLHYEVRKNKKAVNPIYYFFKELSPQQYHSLYLTTTRGGQCLD